MKPGRKLGIFPKRERQNIIRKIRVTSSLDLKQPQVSKASDKKYLEKKKLKKKKIQKQTQQNTTGKYCK